ncbi:hypothetical protein ARMGADRAFT_1039525 [Armillaria gallica]|uniref:Uncharacterized protein n=1 Tax=Armillaria gallica TaxID=47427 RepID=A0A2H3D0T4_ARMGA|nr:hypothetical protein ARMGADRAFT_1039525 [Armillaria gallica]
MSFYPSPHRTELHPLMKSYVETANDALIKQVILFLDPNWFGQMTPFMCAEYTRIRDINNYRKMQAFEQAYEAEAGELGPEGIYSVMLMPVLKVISNGSMISDLEVHPNGGMADKWESNDEGEEEGQAKKFSAKLKLRAELYLCQGDLPQHVADPSSFGIGDRSACNHMITPHTWSLDPKEENPSGIGKEEDYGRLSHQGGPETPGNMLCESPNWVKYDWLGKPEHSGLGCIGVPEDQENGKPAWQNVSRSAESILLSREVADDDIGMFQEYSEENLRWKYWNFSSDTCEGIVQLSKSSSSHMSAPPNFTNFTFWCRQGEFWLATSDPMSSDVETGPSDGEGNNDKDMGYRAAATLAGLVTYGASSDDSSGEEEEEVEEEVEQKRKSSAERKEDKDHDADNEREEEEKVDELEGRGVSNAVPALKKKDRLHPHQLASRS